MIGLFCICLKATMLDVLLHTNPRSVDIKDNTLSLNLVYIFSELLSVPSYSLDSKVSADCDDDTPRRNNASNYANVV